MEAPCMDFLDLRQPQQIAMPQILQHQGAPQHTAALVQGHVALPGMLTYVTCM